MKLYNLNYAIVLQASLYSALWCPQWIALVDCTTKQVLGAGGPGPSYKYYAIGVMVYLGRVGLLYT